MRAANPVTLVLLVRPRAGGSRLCNHRIAPPRPPVNQFPNFLLHTYVCMLSIGEHPGDLPAHPCEPPGRPGCRSSRQSSMESSGLAPLQHAADDGAQHDRPFLGIEIEDAVEDCDLQAAAAPGIGVRMREL